MPVIELGFDKLVNALRHLGLEGLLADDSGPSTVKAPKKTQRESVVEERHIAAAALKH